MKLLQQMQVQSTTDSTLDFTSSRGGGCAIHSYATHNKTQIHIKFIC